MMNAAKHPMKILLMKLSCLLIKQMGFQNLLNNQSEGSVCNVLWSCKLTAYVDMGNEEIGENEETGEDDKADDNEIQQCNFVPGELK